MNSLSIANAIIALESKNYEQASNRRLAFMRVVGNLSITCRVNEDNGTVYGAFVANLFLVGLGAFQAKATSQVINAADITRVEAALIERMRTAGLNPPSLPMG